MKKRTMKSMRTLRNLFWSVLAAWLLSAGNVSAQTVSGSPSPSVDFTLGSPLNITGGIAELVKAIIDNIVMPLGVSVAALAIIYSGFLYIKAQGNPGEIGKAHEALKWTLVGTAVLLGAWVIAQLIGGTIEQLRSAI
ncbi:MAG: hypothetical protein HYY92_00440 [Parcubacteria group bacterium]|nr:hypothetical protein [Parcubacteria group bacterium]